MMPTARQNRHGRRPSARSDDIGRRPGHPDFGKPEAGGKVSEPIDNRQCTCHPDDNPPVPCSRKFALTDCRLAHAEARAESAEAALRIAEQVLDALRIHWKSHDQSEVEVKLYGAVKVALASITGPELKEQLADYPNAHFLKYEPQNG